MMKEELIVAAASLAVTCGLLILRQFAIKRRRPSNIFIARLDNEGGSDGPDDDWPPGIPAPEEHVPGMRITAG